MKTLVSTLWLTDDSAGITFLTDNDLQSCSQNHCEQFETATVQPWPSLAGLLLYHLFYKMKVIACKISERGRKLPLHYWTIRKSLY